MQVPPMKVKPENKKSNLQSLWETVLPGELIYLFRICKLTIHDKTSPSILFFNIKCSFGH